MHNIPTLKTWVGFASIWTIIILPSLLSHNVDIISWIEGILSSFNYPKFRGLSCYCRIKPLAFEMKITAIDRPTPICFLGEQIERIGCRLMNCANELGLPSFKFHTITKIWEDTSIVDLHRDADEVLVVIDLFSFSILMEESIFFDAPSPRDTVLNNIKKMRPDVFIQSIMNRSYGSSFLSRFRETLFYYMALFDMLDTTIPRESKSRLVFEKAILGCYAFNGISCEGMDLVERPEKYRQWQTRNQRAGLRQLPLKSSIVKVVKDEVMKHYHKDFMICQDGQWLLQGWMGRVLSAHTTWVANEEASSG
jgi:hypothetical protein